MSQPHHDRTPFVAACPDCDVERGAESPNEIVEFYRRHYRHTGHDVVLRRADLDVELEDADAGAATDVAAVVAALEPRYESGVPIGIVAAATGRRGATVGETLERIHEVRMTGALYEPRDDHLAAF
ncbi:hypothetical protein [Natronococcus wangiae]|uniref:hypothetical protein n=1 Tax=Natronococcus wangiae TaxID=3068275 RepID=UPI00273E4C6E|nr:hypothetical protein [Natronococcus sp. AD5]